MFELLLQADRSLSEGLLDQAERTYWQLIELDPTNAIAVSGLARISLQRGDERLARTFADRALGIDPDSIAARQVLQALDEGTPASTGSGPPELPLRGAELLEALSRRRNAAREGDEGADGAGPTGASKGATRPGTARRPRAAGAAASPGRQSRGWIRPDDLEHMPPEPLPERRRAGRLAAAAAAAAAAVGEPAHARHEPHQAMPSGRHLFQPEMLKAPPSDPFSEAEMAAAVAAVDALDEGSTAPVSGSAAPAVEAAATEFEVARAVEAAATEFEAEPEVAVQAGVEPRVEPEAEVAVQAGVEPRVEPEAEVAVEAELEAQIAGVEARVEGEGQGDLEHVLEAVDATEARDSVALRLALLSGTAEMPADPDRSAGWPGSGSLDAAEAAWWRAPEAAPIPSERSFEEESSEEDAELRAFRAAREAVMSAADAAAAATERQPWASEELPRDADASAFAPDEAESGPRKKGLFRRLRGS